jgi:hypothetical protein
MTRQAVLMLPSLLDITVDPAGTRSAAFAHTLRRMQRSQEWPRIDSDTAERIVNTATLPSVQEQADNVIRWLAETQRGPGDLLDIYDNTHGAIIGVLDEAGLIFILMALEQSGLIYTERTQFRSVARLTFDGWHRWEELRRGATSGTKAFMAMGYGNVELDRIVNDYFRPAVAETGFTLFRLDDAPRAGLLDDRMRIEIQGARFLIADLTDGNNGAYWEAGYADGLGKPVIYTCERERWNDPGGGRTHFDTNHHLHVLWSKGDLNAAMNALKATIRATIPEAKRDDCIECGPALLGSAHSVVNVLGGGPAARSCEGVEREQLVVWRLILRADASVDRRAHGLRLLSPSGPARASGSPVLPPLVSGPESFTEQRQANEEHETTLVLDLNPLGLEHHDCPPVCRDALARCECRAS